MWIIGLIAKLVNGPARSVTSVFYGVDQKIIQHTWCRTLSITDDFIRFCARKWWPQPHPGNVHNG